MAILLVLFAFPFRAWSQVAPSATDSLPNTKQIKLAAAGLAVGYTGMLLVLSQTWYAENERTRFHFYNDNHQWKQMDKAGHFWGSFQESRLGIAALRAAHVPEKKAIIYGGLLGVVLQSPIELLDGYAADYGASWGDLGANALGSLGVISQEMAWGEVRILPKYSFRKTSFAGLRPNVLGSNLPEQLLKDYNGQTYWLSFDVPAFLPAGLKYPKWLNLALGYGAQGMVYGSPQDNRLNGYVAYRQYYLALDLNLQHIQTRHKVLKGLFSLLSMIHLPAPTVEYNRKHGFKWHTLYF